MDDKLIYNDQLTIEELPNEDEINYQYLKVIDINRKIGYPEIIGKSQKQISYACAIRLRGIKEFKEMINQQYLVDFIKKNNYLSANINFDNLLDRFVENYINVKNNAKDIIDDKGNMIQAILDINKLIIHTGKF